MPKNVGSIKTCSAEYPVGVGSSRLELKSECAVFFFSTELFLVVSPYWRITIIAKQLFMWLQSSSVLSSFGVVLMPCKVNVHEVRSTLQYYACRIQFSQNWISTVLKIHSKIYGQCSLFHRFSSNLRKSSPLLEAQEPVNGFGKNKINKILSHLIMSSLRYYKNNFVVNIMPITK